MHYKIENLIKSNSLTAATAGNLSQHFQIHICIFTFDDVVFWNRIYHIVQQVFIDFVLSKAKLLKRQHRSSHPTRYYTGNEKLPATREAEQETKSRAPLKSQE